MVALRCTRWALLADVALMVTLYAALLGSSALGADIQRIKWPTAFYGGVMILIAGLLSIVALTLQIIVGIRVRREAAR